MSAVIRLAISPQSMTLIQRDQRAAGRLAVALSRTLQEQIDGVANHLKANLLRGGSPRSPRGGNLPLANRSGALMNSAMARMDGPLSGVYGIAAGPASRYARVILGEGTTTIRPVSAKHLWIPVGKNLTGSGMMRHSPRDLMNRRGPRGGRMLRIFPARGGNMVAFLATGGAYKRGKNKGRAKGDVMFVLKKSVQVEGTDGLRQAGTDRLEQIGQALQAAVDRTLGGTA